MNLLAPLPKAILTQARVRLLVTAGAPDTGKTTLFREASFQLKVLLVSMRS